MGVTENQDTTFRMGHYSSLPIITIYIDNKPFHALLDCGASLSLCSATALKRIPNHLIEKIQTNPDIKVTSVSGDDIKISSSLKIKFTIGLKQLIHPVLITDTDFSSDYDIILGFDFLKRFQCEINFATQNVLVRGESTPIYKYDYGKINVVYINNFGKITRKLKLLPGQSSVVDIKLNNYIAPGSEVLVEPLITNHNIEFHNSICKVNKNGSLSVLINNLSHKNIHLNKNSKIARVDSDIDLRETKLRNRIEELKPEHFDLTGVPPEIKDKLLKLIFEYADVFSVSLQTIGECTIEAPPIELTDYTPIQTRPFPIPVALRETVRAQIEELQRAGILEKSNSSYAFPLILVRKKTLNDWRLVIDYRKLNLVTISSTYKLPLISDILNSLRGANYFSNLDMNSSFHQIKLREEDRHLTAFSSPYGNFQYRHLSFGLKNSPQIFQQIADTMLNGLQPENISAYIDDVIVPSESLDDSLRKLRLVFERFRQYELTLNPKKCRFLQTQVQFLGHIVDKDSIRPIPDNLNTIQHFPIPKSLKSLRRFIGVANYYKSFIEHFSEIIYPLTELTKKKIKFKWTSEAQKAFETIKSKLLSDVRLTHPNFNQPFYLNTDASKIAVGGALLQRDEKGLLRPISYFSRKLKPHEQKWPAIQLETYAILLAIRHYKTYLFGRKFTILSDCKSLNYLIKLESPANRLSRWLLELSNYDFTFEHIKGSENFLCDLLSRDVIDSINTVRTDVPSRDKFVEEQRKDISLRRIIDYLENKAQSPETFPDNYFMDNGLLKRISYRQKRSAREDYIEQIVVPSSLVPYVLEGSETVHYAFYKMYRSIKDKFFWRNMYIDIKNFAASCTKCIEKRGFKITKSPLHSLEIPSQPMELLSLDILGPLPMSDSGNRYVLGAIDHFSKYCMLFPLSDITAKTIASKLIEIIQIFGIPHSILTDLGTNFQSQLFKELANKLQINKLKTTAYRPSTNSQSERINTKIKESLACLSQTASDWDTYVGYYNFIYNNSYHDSTLEKPSYIMFNRDLSLPFHILEKPTRMHYFPCEDYISENILKMQHVYNKVYQNLEFVAAKQTRLRDKIATKKSFEVGQTVYLYTPATKQSTGRAFSKKFSGPFRVIQKHSDLNYTIQENNKPFSKPVKVHVDRMFNYAERRLDLQIPSQPNSENSNVIPSKVGVPDNHDTNHLLWYDDVEGTDIPAVIHNRNTEIQKTAIRNERTLPNNAPSQSKTTQRAHDNSINTEPKQVIPADNSQTQPKQETHTYNLRSRSTPQNNTPFPNRMLNWAMNSGDNSNANIIDKISNALANRLANDLDRDQINAISIKPQETKIYYNTLLKSIKF